MTHWLAWAAGAFAVAVLIYHAGKLLGHLSLFVYNLGG